MAVNVKVRFETLVGEHHRRLRAFALALVPRDDVADDLVQEALLTAHRSFDRFDAARDFGAWVRGIVRMKYLEWTRARRTLRLDDDVLDSIEAQHRIWDRAAEEGKGDALEAIRRCMGKLAEHLGAVVRLFYLERRSCARVARDLGTNEVAVRKRLQRARESLADCLRRGDDE